MHKFLRFEEKLSFCFGEVSLMQEFMEKERRDKVFETYKRYATENIKECDRLVPRQNFVDGNGAFVRSAKSLKIPENIDLEPWIDMSVVFCMDSKTFSLVMEEIAKFPFARCGTVSPHTSFPLPIVVNGRVMFFKAIRLMTIKGYSGFDAGTIHGVS
ncbi:hypothetical protein LAU_0125 [Lausannevirus]|uniref:Uncharacterized protein n=2 Tax=Lausannevirus TaxID=999883 RepID=A0A0N7G2D3_9VIRU|nr:hypothetical protein LAU_0125 [Lausannevirus]AEA06976.1 hypothetical protein LAU_0125 [Lausannevirus]ALH06808.1 hypothetical protein PMV_110 [Port-miou virus]